MENKHSAAAALSSIDGEDVTTWALPEGAIARLGRGSVLGRAFSPDGQYFAVGTSIGLWLYELPTLSPIALWNTERGRTGAVAFSPDSRRIVISTFGGNLIVWNIQRGACIAQMEKFDSQELCPPIFSQDGQHLVAADYRMKNRKIYVWDSHTGKKIKETEIHHPYNVYPLCFSPDLSLLAAKNSRCLVARRFAKGAHPFVGSGDRQKHRHVLGTHDRCSVLRIFAGQHRIGKWWT